MSMSRSLAEPRVTRLSNACLITYDRFQMKYQAPERVGWVYELAQSWLKTGRCTDLIVTCVDDDGVKTDLSCHKILMLPFLIRHCPPEVLEDSDNVIMPDISHDQVKQYLQAAYGLSKEEGEWNGDIFSKLFTTTAEVKVTSCVPVHPLSSVTVAV